MSLGAFVLVVPRRIQRIGGKVSNLSYSPEKI